MMTVIDVHCAVPLVQRSVARVSAAVSLAPDATATPMERALKIYGLGVIPVLNHRVDVMPLDGDLPLVRAVDQTPDNGVTFESAYGGRRVHSEHFPTRMRWCGPTMLPVPDFNDSNFLNISERARKVIEEVEPGIHQFVPVTFVDENDEPFEQRFFWVVCNRIDSMDHEKTSFVLLNGTVWRALHHVRRRAPDQVPRRLADVSESHFAFNPVAIGHAQAWRDKHWDLGFVFLSQTFVDAARAAGLTGSKFSELGGGGR